MHRLLTAVALLLALAAPARTYVYGVTGGGPTISPASTSPGLQPGDTLLVGGTYYQLNFRGLQGTVDKLIYVVCLPSQLVTSSAAYTAGEWSDCAFVKLVAFRSVNNLAPVHWIRARCHDLTFDGCTYLNDRGRYSDKQVWLFDDKYSTAMTFDGTKATTFYNVTIVNCRVSGFRETNVLELGSEGKRSVCTDFTVERCSFRNLTSYAALIPGVLGGTVFNLGFRYNRVDSVLADAGAYQRVHASALTGYGNGEVAYNVFETMYANPVRWNPLTWAGLPGYAGPLLVHDNLVHGLLSYDAFELNNNNSGPRIAALGCDTAATDVYHNTVVRTTRMSYNGDYHGYVVGLLAHKVRVRYNVIVDPEHGTTYDPAGRLGYAVAFISGDQPGFDSAGNRCFPTAAAAGLDTAGWQLTALSPLVDAVDVSPSTQDLDGVARPQGLRKDRGALERPAAVPPSRRLLSVVTTTDAGQLVVTLLWSDGTSSVYR